MNSLYKYATMVTITWWCNFIDNNVFPFSRLQEIQERGRELQVETMTKYPFLVKRKATLQNHLQNNYEDIPFILLKFAN